jgi:hypothetical protein
MEPRGSPRQRGASQSQTSWKAMSTGSRCRHPVNSTRRAECLAANNRGDVRNLARDSSYPSHMARIGYALKAVRWIPHTLTSELKHTRVTMCVQLFPKLPPHAHDDWHDLVTWDENESSFHYEYVRSRIWTARDNNAREVANRTIGTRKSMLTAHCVMESPRVPVPCCDNVATWGFVSCNIVH